MIIKANEIKKRSRAGMKNPLRGIYVGEDYDLLAAVMARYPSAVATLETALSLHGITDEYLNPPFFLSFNIGYRPIKDERIVQIWEDRNTRALGTIAMERDGVEYFFLDKADFEKKIEENAFLEYAKVHDHYYGTPKAHVLQMLDEGTDVILEIDVQGAAQIKEKLGFGVLIFIAPPSIQVLKERLVNRKTDSDAQIQLRMKKHKHILVANLPTLNRK